MTAIKTHCTSECRVPSIKPDYSGIVIPPTIAPLNFKIMERGSRFIVIFSSAKGDSIAVDSKSPAIRVPLHKWRNFCQRGRGQPLTISCFVRDSAGTWHSFAPLRDTIAAAPIDGWVTYRALSFLYNYSTDIHIRQRNLGSFREFDLINTNNFAWGCCNCHIPLNNEPGRFTVQVRSANFGNGMLIADSGKISKIRSRLGYAAWHPGGGTIVFSNYKVQQCFHTTGANFIDAYDAYSDLVAYDKKLGKIAPVEPLSQKQALETWPVWSPDGRFLYFCSAPVLWEDFEKVPPDNYDKVRYSLMRISYDAEKDAWGGIDTVLSAQKTGLSISQPRFSHDGRFLLFCMHRFGAYPHTQKSSDLYMMNMASKKYERLGVSSDYSEAWHGWSSNDQWILFSSKRDGGIFTRIYFSYVDTAGRAHKAFIMPQEDPAFYDSYTKCYNVPEFETGAVPFSERELLRAITSPAQAAPPLPETSVNQRDLKNKFIQ